MWDDEPLDAAINETARQMTAGDPRADFGRRVMARIEAGSGLRRPAAAFRSWRPALAALSVGALILLAVIVSREPKRLDGPRRQSSPVASSVPPTAPPLPDAIVPSPDARPTVRLKADPTYSNLKADPTYSNRVDVHTPPDAESLAPPSIDLESIAVAALAEDQSIRVEPLPPLAPIAVTPLGVENEGDRR